MGPAQIDGAPRKWEPVARRGLRDVGAANRGGLKPGIAKRHRNEAALRV